MSLGAAVGSLVSSRPYNQTGVRMQTLVDIGKSLITVPEDFEIHKDVQKLLQSRKKMLETGEGKSLLPSPTLLTIR